MYCGRRLLSICGWRCFQLGQQYDKNISKLEANFGNLSSKEIEQLENDYDSTINSLEKAKNKLEDSLSEILEKISATSLIII